MTYPRSPEEGELIDVMEVDAEIEALRLGLRPSGDDGLRLLAELRDDIDFRAAAVLGAHDLGERREYPVPVTSVSRRSTARRLTRPSRLAVLPAAGALVLASTGVAAALSSTPRATFYPLHRLIFGAAGSSDAVLTRDLADAGRSLDLAAAQPFASRGTLLAQAQASLALARALLPQVISGSARAKFAQQISADDARARRLAAPPHSGPAKTGPASSSPAPVAPGGGDSSAGAAGGDSGAESGAAGAASEDPQPPAGSSATGTSESEPTPAPSEAGPAPATSQAPPSSAAGEPTEDVPTASGSAPTGGGAAVTTDE